MGRMAKSFKSDVAFKKDLAARAAAEISTMFQAETSSQMLIRMSQVAGELLVFEVSDSTVSLILAPDHDPRALAIAILDRRIRGYFKTFAETWLAALVETSWRERPRKCFECVYACYWNWRFRLIVKRLVLYPEGRDSRYMESPNETA